MIFTIIQCFRYDDSAFFSSAIAYLIVSENYNLKKAVRCVFFLNLYR